MVHILANWCISQALEQDCEAATCCLTALPVIRGFTQYGQRGLGASLGDKEKVCPGVLALAEFALASKFALPVANATQFQIQLIWGSNCTSLLSFNHQCHCFFLLLMRCLCIHAWWHWGIKVHEFKLSTFLQASV